MSEPSRPPPPRAYTPSRPKENQSLGTSSTDPPIPPRPPPEVIEDTCRSSPPKPQRAKHKSTGPPPPPAPYSKRPSQTSLPDNGSDVSQPSSSKRPPPPSLPSRPPPAGVPMRSKPSTSSVAPSKPPMSKRTSRDITILSAQPMNSDVIPPPNVADNKEQSDGSSDVIKSVPPPKKGPPPRKPSQPTVNVSTKNNLDNSKPTQSKSTEVNPPDSSTHPLTNVPKKSQNDPPPPSYPAPPVPSLPVPSPPSSSSDNDSVNYPPKPTSPAPPVPKERVKKSSVINPQHNKPVVVVTEQESIVLDTVVDIGVGQLSKETMDKPTTQNTSTDSGASVTKPLPSASGKAKPRKQFVINQDTVSNNATNDSSTDVTISNSPKDNSKQAPNDSDKQNSKPDNSESLEASSIEKTSTNQPSVKTKPSTAMQENTEVKKPIRKAPPPRKGPPPPPQSVKQIEPTSSSSNEKVKPVKPVSKAPPPPRKGPPPPPTSSKEKDTKDSPLSSPSIVNKTPSKKSHPSASPPKVTEKHKEQSGTTEKVATTNAEIKIRKPAPRPPPPRKEPPPKQNNEIKEKHEVSVPVTQPEEESPTNKRTKPPPPKSLENDKKPDGGNSIRSNSVSSKPKPPPIQKQLPDKLSPTITKTVTQSDSNSSVTNTSRVSSSKLSPPVSKPANPVPTKSSPPAKPGPPKQGPSRPGPPKSGPPKPGPPKPGPPRPGSRSSGPKKPHPPSGGPVPTKRTTTGRNDQPPGLPPRPTPGHPLYKYVCTEPHGLASSNAEAEEADELSYMEGDVIELIEKIDDYWFWARNADNEGAEGLILATDLKIVKRLPGEDKVAGFDDGPCAVAMSAFVANQDDELGFKEGDLIMLISRIGADGQWLRGRTMRGDEGIFPKSFVEIVEDLPSDAIEEPLPAPAPEITYVPDGPYCVAVETFEGQTPEDLSFERGDVIILTERLDESWLKGTVNGETGMFPQVFVDVLVDIPVGVVQSATVVNEESVSSATVTALFDFEGQSEEELTFKANDIITVTHCISDEWIYGIIGSSEGMFPTAFIDNVPNNLPMKKDDNVTVTNEINAKEEPTKVQVATGKCEAIFDFETEADGELPFSIGEIIITTEWINDDWMSGMIGERMGMFPLSFVKVISELPKLTVEKKTSTNKKVLGGASDDLLPKGVALSDFRPSNAAEIAIKEGDEVYLLTRETPKLYLGENIRTGDIGNFPIKIIQVITQLP